MAAAARCAGMVGLVLALARCVPADDALPLGSVRFTFGLSSLARDGVPAGIVADAASLTFDRVIVGYKTMTIGQIDVPDLCSYRGRGADTDVVVNARRGVVQTFNGLQPYECPDVGLLLGPPGDGTVLGAGATSADLVDLAAGEPAHALVDATATMPPLSPGAPARNYQIRLRFATADTASRFGGCRDALTGIRIVANQRGEVNVLFAAENLFRDAISTSSHLRVGPFIDADENGDADGIVTMDELEAYPLARIPGEFYSLPDRGRSGSLADFVRQLFRFTLMFRTEQGLCVGNEPGSGE